MTKGGQTRKGSTLPKLLTPETITKIGTWNVRSMFEAGIAAIIAKDSAIIAKYSDYVKHAGSKQGNPNYLLAS